MIDAYILEALGSPRTKAKGSGGLYELTPSDLLAQLYHALVLRTQVDPLLLSEVILGCITRQGEQAANIAKTSALQAGWPASVVGLTVNQFCSSSIDAIALAAMKVNCGQSSALVIGGVEMTSRVLTLLLLETICARTSMLWCSVIISAPCARSKKNA